MKILVFTSLYPNNRQPTHGVFVKERMTAVSRLPDCQVTVVAPVPYFPPVRLGRRWLYSEVARKEVIEGVEVHHPRYFMIPKVAMSLHGPLMFLSLWPYVRRLHRERRFDLIDAHYVYPDGFAGVCLAQALRLPIVVTARGSDIHRFADFPTIRRMLRFTLRRADRAIAVSRALKRGMTEIGIPEPRIAVLPNGVDPEKFYPMPRDEARSELNLGEGDIILSVGHLVPVKGFALLIRAIRQMLDRGERPRARLFLVGEGEERQRLESVIASLQLADTVRLVGAVPHARLRAWYSAADVFCLPSLREGWPNVLLEAMACGTPVVATAVWGTPEIVSSDAVGLLVREDEAEISRGLERALSRVWDRKALTCYARAHSWDNVAGSVREVFQSVLNGRCVPERARDAVHKET